MKITFTLFFCLFISIVQSQEPRIVFKGEILEEGSNTPVSFANLTIKGEGIYRVADENGYYELPINKNKIPHTSVVISSMGFESDTLLLKDLNNKTFLKLKFEQLPEVLITGNLSAKTVLQKAISKKGENHPVEPFNFYRYGNVLIIINDEIDLDLELITKDSDDGYLSPYVITQRVEQIKWNENKNPKKYKYSSQFFSYRENAIRFANILHKKKYKNFELNFVKSNNTEDEDVYIIGFQTERSNWNYTNKGYPTQYSGRVYISKENFAILKVVQNWGTTLNKYEIKKHMKGYKNESFQDIVELSIKEENICTYSRINDDGKYYATHYYNKRYMESINEKHEIKFTVFERDSYLFDFDLKDFEEIEFEFKEKDQTVLNRVDYNESFWDSFYKLEVSRKLKN